MSHYLNNMSGLFNFLWYLPQQTRKDKNTPKKYRERTDVTLSLCYSNVRANVSDIDYESMPEEHVRITFYKWD